VLLLWDHTIEGHAAEIGHLGRAELCEIATRTIESTMELFQPPFSEYFPDKARELVEYGVDRCKETMPAWHLEEGVASDFYSRFDSLPKLPIRPGVGPFLMAVQRLVEGAAGVVDIEVALEIMSACYEAILVSQLTGRVTTQMQEENEPCCNAIRIQENLISEYSSR
jgi:hypothetical protein